MGVLLAAIFLSTSANSFVSHLKECAQQPISFAPPTYSPGAQTEFCQMFHDGATKQQLENYIDNSERGFKILGWSLLGISGGLMAEVLITSTVIPNAILFSEAKRSKTLI